MNGQQRLAFIVFALMLVLETCVSAPPRREKRWASWSLDHGGSRDLGEHRRPGQRSNLAAPKTYRYTVERPGKCSGDDDLFAHCYLCGKLMEDVRVYEGCCEPQETIKDFCDKLLSY